MILNPTNFILNTDLGGLGSADDVSGSFSVGAQVLGAATLYDHPLQVFDTDEEDFTALIQVKLGFESRWRQVNAFDEWEYNTDFKFIPNGTTAAGTMFSVYLTPSYAGKQVQLRLNMVKRSLAASVNVPAFDVQVRIFLHKPPIDQ